MTIIEAVYRCFRCEKPFRSLGELDPGDRICTPCIEAQELELRFIEATGLDLPPKIADRDAALKAWKEAIGDA